MRRNLQIQELSLCFPDFSSDSRTHQGHFCFHECCGHCAGRPLLGWLLITEVNSKVILQKCILRSISIAVFAFVEMANKSKTQVIVPYIRVKDNIK